MTTHTPASKNWWQRQSKLVKGIIIGVVVIVILAIFGNIAGGDEDTDATASETTAAPVTETTAPAPQTTEDAPAPETSEAPAIPEWQTSDDYKTWCGPDSAMNQIDPELQSVADSVAVPEQGHVISLFADHGTDVIARVCAPIKGDELARVAEDLAIGVRASSIGEQVATMRVSALPDDSDPSAKLADMDFQIRLHNGVGDEGAVLSAWKSLDER